MWTPHLRNNASSGESNFRGVRRTVARLRPKHGPPDANYVVIRIIKYLKELNELYVRMNFHFLDALCSFMSMAREISR